MSDWINVAIGILIRQENFLICRRRLEDPLGGYWEFPGGKCEPGESPEHCLVRELQEELGVVAQAVEAFAPIEFEYPRARVRLHPFLCQLISGEPAPLAATESRWVRGADLRDYPFPPANDPLLDTLIRRFGQNLSDE